jgi:hypothetical protein
VRLTTCLTVLLFIGLSDQLSTCETLYRVKLTLAHDSFAGQFKVYQSSTAQVCLTFLTMLFPNHEFTPVLFPNFLRVPPI